LGELGGEPHRTATGQPIAVTPWSAMAQVVLLEPRSARAVLDDIDRYGAQVEDSALPPAWPMAMAVAAAPEYGDAHAEAHAVIAAHTPRGVAPGSAIGATISGVLNALVGNSTADAWHAVQHAPPGPASEHADLTYLRRAIVDDTWLNQLGPIPLGPRRFQPTSVPAELSAAVGPALEQARGVGPDQVVRLVDLLMRAGVDDDQLSAALSREVVASEMPSAADTSRWVISRRRATRTTASRTASSRTRPSARSIRKCSPALVQIPMHVSPSRRSTPRGRCIRRW